MQITSSSLAQILGVKPSANLVSVHEGLKSYGAELGLNRPHRLVPYLAQLSHESGGFLYDREVWGPTAAQKRYDTRTDLGNTAAKDGDGYKNRGRGPIQVTGAYNIAAFYDWCCEKFGARSVPDFRADPDLINTDPWEGLSALWYWDSRNLNQYADSGNFISLTKAINGGLNGFADRQVRYTHIGLAVLGFGFGTAEVKRFQTRAGLQVDGVIGPITRLKIHDELTRMDPVSFKDNRISPLPDAAGQKTSWLLQLLRSLFAKGN